MTETLSIEPIRDGYTFQPSYTAIEIALDGGLSRRRQDYLFAPHRVDLNWLLTSSLEYSKFMGFFRNSISNGTDAFLMNLLSDVGELTLHKCRVMGGLPKLTQQRGQAYYASCTLEVEVNPTFTERILYREPNFIILNTNHPTIVGAFEVGDQVRIMYSEGIHPTGSTPLNLDGIYTVSGLSGTDTLELSSPAVVNADWTTLASLGAPGEYGPLASGNVISTITYVPT